MIDKALLIDCTTGLDYPADVTSIVDQAQANGCPFSVVSQLESSPSRTFSSRDELLCRLGDVEACDLGRQTV